MKKNTFWRVALPVGIALWTAFIWSRSLMTGAASTADSNHVAGVFAAWFGWDAEAFWLTYLVRKSAHFLEFAALGLLWGGCGRAYGRRWLWACGLPVGAIDECLQMFVPGRSAMLMDVGIDVVGFLCGWALLWIFLRHRKKMK